MISLYFFALPEKIHEVLVPVFSGANDYGPNLFLSWSE
jgi:hypothetical protein